MAKLKQKDTALLALWISDDDPPAKLKWWREQEAPRIFNESADAAGATLGPMRWYELSPGEGLAGTPPKDIQGTNVRLLVAEADVVDWTGLLPDGPGFLDELTYEDLVQLRQATRRSFGPCLNADGKSYRELRDDECDRIINLVGPEAAVREMVSGTIH